MLIEVDLVTADDLGHETLVNSLTQLATAGLHGMVSSIVRVCLDGEQVSVGPTSDASRVRPPPDPRVKAALMEMERVSALLRSIDPPEPALQAV